MSVLAVLRSGGLVAVVFLHDGGQHSVPPCRCGHLEQQDHGLAKGLEVEVLVHPASMLDVHEEGHAEDGVDEHHQEQEQADVEEGGQGHGQGEQ